MSTLRRRTSKNGKVTYQVQVRMRGKGQVTRSFDRLTDARLWAAHTEADIKLSRALPGAEARNHTVKDAIKRYVETVVPRRSAGTARHLASQLQWWRDRLGALTLDQVGTALIVECREELGDGREPATVNRYMAALSGLFTAASREWRWVVDNPCRGVRRLREAAGRLRFLDEGELSGLLEACRQSADPRLLPAVRIALGTGMRKSELLGLTWRRVDFGDRMVRLETSKNREPRGIPMSDEVEAAFLALKGLPAGIDGKVFHGLPMDWPRVPFRAALKAAGVEDFRWHDLRHTAASYMAMRGVPLRTIGEVLGHRSIVMTMRYSHLSKQHLREVLADLGQAIGGVEKKRMSALTVPPEDAETC